MSKRIVFRTVWTIVGSVAIPLIAGLLKDDAGEYLFTTVEQVVIGVVLFGVSSLIALAVDVARLLELRERQHLVDIMHDQTDLRLSNIRKSMGEIAHTAEREANFYYLHFDRELTHFEIAVHAAAEKGELHVKENLMPTTSFLLDTTERRGCDQISGTHRLDSHPNDFDHSAWARSYYERLEQITANTNVELRRLFIFSDKGQLETELPQRLFGYSKSVGLGYRAISSKDWHSLVMGHSVSEAHNEFGIWGDLVFLSDLTAADEVSGKYSYEPSRVTKFKQLFDDAWKQSTVPSIISPRKRVTLNDLFDEHCS